MSETKKVDTADAVLKEFKNLNIEEADFEFYCGGDSMGETDITAVDKNGDNVALDSSFYTLLEDEVYDNCTFYDASDGHYMGEFGNVIITYNEESDSLAFDKNSKAEFIERFGGIASIPLNKEEYNFLNNYVSNINFSPWDSENINYKTDFILTDEFEVIQKSIFDKFYECCENLDVEAPEDAEESDEGLSYHTGRDFDDNEPIEFQMIDDVNHIKVWFEKEFTIYHESLD